MSKQELTRADLERRVEMGRSYILIYTILSAVNIVMLVFGVSMMFLSSISAPYYLVWIGKAMDNGFAEGAWPVISDFTLVGAILAAILLVIYAICWSTSKKHMGWSVIALVLFIVDTVILGAASFFLYGNIMVSLLDFLFHFWIIFLLIRCIRAHKQLCRMDRLETQEDSSEADYE